MPKLLEEFPPLTTAEWEAAIQKDLKGADYNKKLVWRTDDGIAVKPYYRSEDLAGLEYLEAARPPRAINDWQIADTIPENISVDASRFEESGATTVQELAYALAEGIEFLAEHKPDDITFSFAMGSSYFFQIAKLRAFRLLWSRVAQAFDSPVKMHLHCRTSRWNKSIYDAHVNILRGTTEAMSAALGGADSITVEPFDARYKTPDAASLRLAHNTQLILQKEAYLDRVADPAAGSYYIESLTDSLSREAWKQMQRIEEFGGFHKAHDSGMIPSELAESRRKRDAAVAQRRKVFVGVNQYPNLAERMLDKIEPHHVSNVTRGPEIFESIRLRTEESGESPLFLLAEFGDVKMRKARSQFITNFFGCAGFTVETRAFASMKEVAGAQSDVIVLCSSDAEYLPAVVELKKELKAIGRSTAIIVAGMPKDADALKAAGVAEFVNIKSNAAETLQAWQERLS